MSIEEFKSNLNNIIAIQDLPIVENIEENTSEGVRELFNNEYEFTLKDGCHVKMSKSYYICAQENRVDFSQIYTINSKYNTIFKCFNCGSFLTLRNDLVEKYDENKIIPKKVLFPMRWKDKEIIAYIENLIYMIKFGEQQ